MENKLDLMLSHTKSRNELEGRIENIETVQDFHQPNSNRKGISLPSRRKKLGVHK